MSSLDMAMRGSKVRRHPSLRPAGDTESSLVAIPRGSPPKGITVVAGSSPYRGESERRVDGAKPLSVLERYG